MGRARELPIQFVMRVLITWGTKGGGTESIAKIIAETLAQEGELCHLWINA